MAKGRPHAGPIGKLRTKVWFEITSRGLGGRSPYWFWKVVDGGNGDRSTWERYKRGLRDASPHNGVYRVAMTDFRFPGSGSIFRTGMWDILEGEHFDEDRIILEIGALGDPVRQTVLRGGYGSDDVSRSIDRMFYELEQFPNFKTLAAIVLLLEWANALQNHDLWNSFCGFYRHIIPYFIDRGQVPFHEEVFDAIDRYAKVRTFPKLNERIETFRSWTEELPRYQTMVSDLKKAEKLCFERMPKEFCG